MLKFRSTHHKSLPKIKPLTFAIGVDEGNANDIAITFIIDDAVYYCVANMPGAVAHTSTYALNNATLPFAVQLANKGWKKACQDDAHLANGINIEAGNVTFKAVADDLDLPYVAASL